jgi:hypothetical protein
MTHERYPCRAGGCPVIAVTASARVEASTRVRTTELSTDDGDFVALVVAEDDAGRDVMLFGQFDDLRRIAVEAVALLDRFGRMTEARS